VIGPDVQTRLKSIAEEAGARLRLVPALPPAHPERIQYVRFDIS
jgi:hypothetical protein